MNVVYQKQGEFLIAEIPVRSSRVGKITSLLRLLGVREMGPEGGHGWQYDDGGFIIIGNEKAVFQVVESINMALKGPKWQTGAEIYAKQKQGAMP